MSTIQVQRPSTYRWEYPNQVRDHEDIWEVDPLSYLLNHPDSLFVTPQILVGETTIPRLDTVLVRQTSHFWLEIRAAFVQISWIVQKWLLSNAKRCLDIIVSLAVLPLILPVLAITALAVRMESEGPVVFKQKRVGKWGKPFTCYKFRSMYRDAEARKAALMHLNEADGLVFKIKKDPRITRVGRIIRKTSLDELPQIVNVIKGDMSLVGPRPPVPCEVEKYCYDTLRRLDVVPGITGLQQVMGRSDVEFKRWIELDVQYVREGCLLKDIKILLLTIPAVITGRGAY